MNTTIERFKRVSITEVTTPGEGRVCLLNRWWIVTDQEEVLFFRGFSPQCNHDRSITERLNKIPNTTVRFIEVAYMPRRD